MLRLNMIRLGFLLGVSLLLAAIVYFFAANWGGLDRIGKVAAAAGLVILFYGMSLVFDKIRDLPGHRAFLSNIFLVGGCISFGIAVGLLGQIYNSHADSYGLFLVWSVPALLLAWVTRYKPFYLLAYMLLHLMLWLYFFPTSWNAVYSDGQVMLIGGLFALLNLILFISLEIKRWGPASLQAAGFIVFHAALLALTNSLEFDTPAIWMNLPDAAAIALGFYYFIRVRFNKAYVALNAMAASAFAALKFAELAVTYASTAFFAFGLVFVALLLAGNVLFFRYLNRLNPPPSASDTRPQGSGTPERDGADPELDDARHAPDDAGHGRTGAVIGKAVTAIVTILGTVVGSVSLIGLVMLVGENDSPEYVLYALSLVLAVPMIALTRISPVIRYTVLTIGYIAGFVSIVWVDQIGFSLPFLLVTAAAWLRMEGKFYRFFAYALFNFNLGIVLHQLLGQKDDAFAYTILLLAALNALLYASRLRMPEGGLRPRLHPDGLFFTLLLLFWLTFFADIFAYSYALFNAVYFAAASLLLLRFLRRGDAAAASISLAFWFAYIAFKYYDLLWTLLHKSITFALLGILILIVTWFAARRIGPGGQEAAHGSRLRKSRVMIALLVLLQLGFLGLQSVRSESLLRNGVSVKLEIVPLDPRSLLQGDYIVLNYGISTPPETAADELRARRQSKVKAVLSPDENGVYEFNRLFRSGEALGDEEVVINGRFSGSLRIRYGIETYFVPEGTGADAERDARFAYVRIGAGGDAMLEKLSKQ